MTHPSHLSPRRLQLALTATLGFALCLIVMQSAPAHAAGAQVLHLSAAAHMTLRFNTSHLSARAGRITIVMSNPTDAGMDHGIAVSGHSVKKTGPIVAPGHSSSVTVTL